MKTSSRVPRLFGASFLTLGMVAGGLGLWRTLFDPGPKQILSAARAMADVALSRPHELLLLIEAGQALAAGLSGAIAIGLGVFLLRFAGTRQGSTVDGLVQAGVIRGSAP